MKRIISYTTRFASRFINVFDLHGCNKNGAEVNWTVASRTIEPKCVSYSVGYPDAVVIVARHIETNKLVITKEFRYPIGNYEYGFPAGLIDWGEDIRSCAIRELKEETGLDVVRITNISPTLFNSPGIIDESCAMVYVECTGTPSNSLNESSEDIETILIDEVEAQELLKKSDIFFGAKAWIIINNFARLGVI